MCFQCCSIGLQCCHLVCLGRAAAAGARSVAMAVFRNPQAQALSQQIEESSNFLASQSALVGAERRSEIARGMVNTIVLQIGQLAELHAADAAVLNNHINSSALPDAQKLEERKPELEAASYRSRRAISEGPPLSCAHSTR